MVIRIEEFDGFKTWGLLFPDVDSQTSRKQYIQTEGIQDFIKHGYQDRCR